MPSLDTLKEIIGIITLAAGAVTALTAAITGLYKLGRQLGFWRWLRSLPRIWQSWRRRRNRARAVQRKAKGRAVRTEVRRKSMDQEVPAPE